MIEPFETTFAVPLQCEDCVRSVSKALHGLPGILNVSANLKDQVVAVEGIAAPSAIVSTIQSTGKDAILRGSGKPNSAAVAILETYAPRISNPVRGLARMVAVSPTITIVDLTLHGLPEGTYHATIREAGDISRGAESTGKVWTGISGGDTTQVPRGQLGKIDVGKNGIGSVLLDRPIQIWELIGRSFVVSRKPEGRFAANDADTIVGVIARSAGVWQNEKTVCSCSGKTIWEERQENVVRGMM